MRYPLMIFYINHKLMDVERATLLASKGLEYHLNDALIVDSNGIAFEIQSAKLNGINIKASLCKLQLKYNLQLETRNKFELPLMDFKVMVIKEIKRKNSPWRSWDSPTKLIKLVDSANNHLELINTFIIDWNLWKVKFISRRS